MKTKHLFVWVCFTLFTGLFSLEVKAYTIDNELNESAAADTLFPAQVKSITAKIAAVQSSIDQLKKELESKKDLSREDIEEIEGKIASLEQSMNRLRSTIAKGKITTLSDSTDEDEDDKSLLVKMGGKTLYRGKNLKMDSTKMAEKKERKLSAKASVGFEMDLGFNTFMYKGNPNLPSQYSNYDLKGFASKNVDLQFFHTSIALIHHNVYLTTGLALDWNNYAFDKGITLKTKSNTLDYMKDSLGNAIAGKFAKNKLVACYLQVPLMLNFETNPDNRDRSFHLAAGGFAGFLIDSYTKQKTDDGYKFHIQDNYDLNKFRYGICGQIGYGNVNLFANYSMSNIFQKGSPEFNNLSFGIVLIGSHW
jgi:peptidoglycan hydrolase CwlO-like protein